MKTAHDVILAPVLTERSSMQAADGKYTFKVASDASKTEIRLAVEDLFDVRVLKVNTQNIEGKEKRMGVHIGRRSSWKKAIVTIDQNPKAGSYMVKGGRKADSTRKYKSAIEEFGFGQ